MIKKLTVNLNFLRKKRIIFLLAILSVCIILTIGLDLLNSKFHDSSFYFSESFLFSSFWLLFVPLLYGQFFMPERQGKRWLIPRILVPIVIHLFAYPAIVWLGSEFFYYHTFSYYQTLHYGLTEYTFILFIVYSVPFVLYSSFKKKLTGKSNYSNANDSTNRNKPVPNFLIIDGNKRMSICTKDILFISSNPPYINIHHTTKKYIHKETLKSVSGKLDNEIFVRVHKSTIVNINKVYSYRSRLNGDYDLTLADSTELRLSRNYSPVFKEKFKATHQDTQE